MGLCGLHDSGSQPFIIVYCVMCLQGDKHSGARVVCELHSLLQEVQLFPGVLW